MLSPGVGDDDGVSVGSGVELAYESEDAVADSAPTNGAMAQNAATTMTARSVDFRRDGAAGIKGRSPRRVGRGPVGP